MTSFTAPSPAVAAVLFALERSTPRLHGLLGLHVHSHTPMLIAAEAAFMYFLAWQKLYLYNWA